MLIKIEIIEIVSEKFLNVKKKNCWLWS